MLNEHKGESTMTVNPRLEGYVTQMNNSWEEAVEHLWNIFFTGIRKECGRIDMAMWYRCEVMTSFEYLP